jgi:hypothetical protein
MPAGLAFARFRDYQSSAFAATRTPTEGPRASPERLQTSRLSTLLYSDFPRFEGSDARRTPLSRLRLLPNIATRKAAPLGPDMAGRLVGLPPQRIATDSWLTERRRWRRRHLRAKGRLLAITSAVRSLRFIVTQRVARLGAGVGGRRRGLLKPKTEANF